MNRGPWGVSASTGPGSAAIPYCVGGRDGGRTEFRPPVPTGVAPAPKVIEEPAEAKVTREIIKRHEEEDPALAAYNRYLARLNSQGR